MTSIPFMRKAAGGLVSIVIPTFNKDQFIGETLASIGRQTYSNWELIVIEDSSRGDTETIVKSFARQHRWHRVEYCRSDRNYGAAHSRNLGFAKARGEFVALIDADDRWLPDHLAASVQALKETGKDLVYSSVLMIEDGTELPLGVWGPDADELKEFPYGLFRRNFITPSATVMRRQVLSDVGPWSLSFRYCEDADYWFRCLVAAKQFHHIGGCHCLYRKNHNGATTQRACATHEEFADISARYVDKIAGTRKKTCSKYASQAIIRAARLHANTNPLDDSSADPTRTSRLIYKAWQHRRKHVELLWHAAKHAAKNLFRRPHPEGNTLGPVAAPVVAPAAIAA